MATRIHAEGIKGHMISGKEKIYISEKDNYS